jgi:restriction endonuclease Mrr
MAIPDFQTLMLPLLRHLGDGKEHSNQETLDALAKEFGLSEAELAQLLPSGTQGLFPSIGSNRSTSSHSGPRPLRQSRSLDHRYV